MRRPTQGRGTWLEWRNPLAQAELRRQLTLRGIEWNEVMVDETEGCSGDIIAFDIIDPVQEVRHWSALTQHMMEWFERYCSWTP